MIVREISVREIRIYSGQYAEPIGNLSELS